MTERYSIAEARRNLPKLVHEAERGKAVELTRRGESVAMLISRRRFEQLASNHSSPVLLKRIKPLRKAPTW